MALGNMASFSETNKRQGNVGQRGLSYSGKTSWLQMDSEVVATNSCGIKPEPTSADPIASLGM